MTTHLTAEQLAARLQLPKPTVYRLAREGMLPCVRAGRSVRFDADEVARWLRQHRREGQEGGAVSGGRDIRPLTTSKRRTP